MVSWPYLSLRGYWHLIADGGGRIILLWGWADGGGKIAFLWGCGHWELFCAPGHDPISIHIWRTLIGLDRLSKLKKDTWLGRSIGKHMGKLEEGNWDKTDHILLHTYMKFSKNKKRKNKKLFYYWKEIFNVLYSK